MRHPEESLALLGIKSATKDLGWLKKQVPRCARDDKPHDVIPRDLLLTMHCD